MQTKRKTVKNPRESWKKTSENNKSEKYFDKELRKKKITQTVRQKTPNKQKQQQKQNQ